MTYGAIDIGTNAVLLLIAVEEAGRFREVADLSTITRLGEGLLKTRRLSEEAMGRTIAALEKHRMALDAHHGEIACAFGTSALREAENREEFIEMAHRRTGFDVKVFSEYEEAYYTYLSVNRDPAILGGNLIIVDIGGGSTEITRGTRERFIDYVSLPVGTVKLTEIFVKHDPPARAELEGLARSVSELLPGNGTWADCTVVGMAGTMTTLAAMILGLEGFRKERIHGLSISLSTLDEWVGRLSGMSIVERRALPGMEAGREDLLLQGMILMREIVASLCTDSFVVSTYGARYGVLYERMQRSYTLSQK